MKARWVIVGLIAVQLLALFARFLPGTSQLWRPDMSASDLISLEFSFVGAQVVLLTLGLSLLWVRDGHDRAEFQRALRAEVGAAATATPLRDDQFYAAFLAAMASAESSVSICYLAPTPPTAGHDEGRAAYYRAAADTIRRNSRVRFRRIVRRTDENIEWVATLVGELAGCPNADIALLKDSRNAEEMPLALSTQVIDDNLVWLVAAEDHERIGRYRDVAIESPVVGEAMQGYFNRLWSKADVVLANGTLTEKGTKVLASAGETP